MLDYKDIINKHYALNMSGREIARETGVSKSGGGKRFSHSLCQVQITEFSFAERNYKSGNCGSCLRKEF